MTLDDIRRALRPLAVRISNVIGRGVIKRVDDAKKVQELQVDLLDGETREEVERFQQYGLSSHPPVGSDCVVIFVGGRRDQGYCLAAEKQGTRIINLSEGEVALYNDTGAKVVMKANGDIEITPKAGQKLKISTSVEITGSLDVSGNVAADGDVTAGAISLNSHIHSGSALVPTVGGVPGTIAGVTGGPS